MPVLTISATYTEEEAELLLAPLLTAATLGWYQRILSGHAQRAAILAQALARGLRRSEQEMRLIGLAALLHDIGKAPSPQPCWTSLVHSRSRNGPSCVVTPRSAIGCLSGLEGSTRTSPHWSCLAHHERWDGFGYPLGLAGEAIPLGARILAVADAYDALTEQRPYRQPRTQAEASAEARRCASSCYDPCVVEALLQVLNGEKRVLAEGGSLTLPDAGCVCYFGYPF